MNSRELKEVLKKHKMWLNGVEGGERADLKGADLQYAKLRGTNLQGANLRHANLWYAGLQGAKLRGADLQGADLRGAGLQGAKLRGADLQGADLRHANLQCANLQDAYLWGAKLPNFQHIPEQGSFIGWKKLEGQVIAKLEIPAEAKRTSSLVGNKCRAEFVKVLELSNGATSGVSKHDNNITYTVGETVYPDSYDDDIRVECTNGIHFFATEQEALDYYY